MNLRPATGRCARARTVFPSCAAPLYEQRRHRVQTRRGVAREARAYRACSLITLRRMLPEGPPVFRLHNPTRCTLRFPLESPWTAPPGEVAAPLELR